VYWLLKSEPDAWSWDQQCGVESTAWTGVRNYQAANFMKQMRVGDLAFFYHSNVGKEIVGIVKVTRAAYPDPTDETHKFVCVDVAAERTLPRPVTLAAIKANPKLQTIGLIKQSRLSVMPITREHWDIILTLGAIHPMIC